MNNELDKLKGQLPERIEAKLPDYRHLIDLAFQLGVKAVLEAQTEGVEEYKLDSLNDMVNFIERKENQDRTKMLSIAKGLLKV
ncbi:MAG: hypothetical protein IIB07_05505 [Bacteroidetes bacterium]|nr:hypothetical protein [Bacteroidota bacterium]